MTVVATRGNLRLVDDGDGTGHLEGREDDRRPLGSFLKWGYWKPVEGAVTAAASSPEEKPLAVKYRQLLELYAKRIARRYADSLTAAGEPDLEQILNSPELTEEQRKKLKAARDAIAREAATAQAVQFGISFAVTSPYLQQLVDQHAGKQAERIVEGSRDVVARVIRQSLEEGWSVPQTAREIRVKLGELAKWQSVMLARTDLISLNNAGSFAAAMSLQGQRPVYKRWINADDEKVRPTHVEAQNQIRPVQVPFVVGGAELMFPGDPSGPDKEVINCRCTQVYLDDPAEIRDHLWFTASGTWDESKHPRDPGGEGGGQWVAKSENLTPAQRKAREDLRRQRELRQAKQGLKPAKTKHDVAKQALRNADRVTTGALKLDAGQKLYHVSYHGDAITEGGFKLSANGESGPGVYLAPTTYVKDRYPERQLLEVTTTAPLRLLDRTTEAGEREFRRLQDSVPGWYTSASVEQRLAPFKAAGWDGVQYDSAGDVEIVVHDPSKLKATLVGAAWDESEHPRHPKGTPVEGGRFAPKGEELFVSEPEDWSAVLAAQGQMERLWREQTQLAVESFPGQVPLNDTEAIAAKVFVQETIAIRLKDDPDFKSLIAVLDPDRDWQAEFGPGGSMETARTTEQQTAALAVKNWATTSSDGDPVAIQFQMAAEEEFGLERSAYVDQAWKDYQKGLAIAYGAPEDSPVYLWMDANKLRQNQVFNDQQMAGARKFLRAQYELTQEMFKAYGITEVYAYRGMRFDGVNSMVPPPKEIVDSLENANERFRADEEAWMAEARKDSSPRLGRAPRFQDYAGQDILSVHQNPLSSWAHSFDVASSFTSGGVVGAVAGTRIDVRRIISTPFTGFGCLDENEMVVLGGTDMDAMVWSWNSDNWRPESDGEFHDQWVEAASRAHDKRKEDRAAKR